MPLGDRKVDFFGHSARQGKVAAEQGRQIGCRSIGTGAQPDGELSQRHLRQAKLARRLDNPGMGKAGRSQRQCDTGVHRCAQPSQTGAAGSASLAGLRTAVNAGVALT
ncbi:hypothetical protein EN916_28360, partial [Mesorhizobium sp. M7A.F.Ca.CA.001.11.2.1]